MSLSGSGWELVENIVTVGLGAGNTYSGGTGAATFISTEKKSTKEITLGKISVDPYLNFTFYFTYIKMTVQYSIYFFSKIPNFKLLTLT